MSTIFWFIYTYFLEWKRFYSFLRVYLELEEVMDYLDHQEKEVSLEKQETQEHPDDQEDLEEKDPPGDRAKKVLVETPVCQEKLVHQDKWDDPDYQEHKEMLELQEIK